MMTFSIIRKNCSGFGGVRAVCQHGDEHQRVTLRHSQFSTLKSMQLTRAETNLMLRFLRTP